MSYINDIADENRKRLEKAKKEEEKKVYSIVCNHIAFPSLFNLKTSVHRIKVNKEPPRGMDGYVYICEECVSYLNNINQETSKRCFTKLEPKEFMKNIETTVGVKLLDR